MVHNSFALMIDGFPLHVALSTVTAQPFAPMSHQKQWRSRSCLYPDQGPARGSLGFHAVRDSSPTDIWKGPTLQPFLCRLYGYLKEHRTPKIPLPNPGLDIGFIVSDGICEPLYDHMNHFEALGKYSGPNQIGRILWVSAKYWVTFKSQIKSTSPGCLEGLYNPEGMNEKHWDSRFLRIIP